MCALLWACDVTKVAPDPEPFVEVEFTTTRTSEPDSVSWTIGKQTGWASQSKVVRDTTKKTSTFWYRVGAPNPPDTIRFGLRSLGLLVATIDMAPQGDGTYLRLAPVVQPVSGKLLARLDSLSKVSGSGLTRSRSGLEILAARLLLDTASLLKDKKQLPPGLDKKVLDSLALREAAKGSVPLAILSRSWLLDLDFDLARAKVEQWVAQGVPGIDSAAYRRLVPLENFPPEVVRLVADTLTVVKGGGKRSFVVELQDDSGMVSVMHTIWQNNLDVSTLFSFDAPAFPTNKPTSWVCTLKVATGTAALGAYTLRTEPTDNKKQKSAKEITFQVAEKPQTVDPGDPPVDPLPTNHAPSVVRQNPLTDTLTVSDVTYSQLFQWSVSDVDNNLAKVFLQGKEIELQNGIAKQELPLKLGDTTLVVIRATDAKGLEDIDTIRIYRNRRVAPKIEILSGVARDVDIPDTQSTCQVRWKVIDTDLDSVKVEGKTYKATEGPEFSLAAKPAPGTDLTVRIVAYDHLGSVVSDSVTIHRAKPVKPVIGYVSGKARDTAVVDTQTTLKTRWKATDTDLDSIWIGNVKFKAVSGQEYEFVSHLAPGASDTLRIVATDLLGSRVLDSLVIRRPDPRSRWKDLIAAVHGGADTVPLLNLSPGLGMGQFEVTRAVYAKYSGAAAPKDSLGFPANRISVYEAILFCNALSKAKGLDTLYAYSTYDAATGYLDTVSMRDTMKANAGKLRGYRLPTRSEWNAAATLWGAYPWGNSTDAKIASAFAVIAGEGVAATGSRNPTGTGFFDLAGNVAEWTSERFGYQKANTRWYSVGGSMTTSDLASVVAPNLMTGLTKDPVIGFRVVRIGSN